MSRFRVLKASTASLLRGNVWFLTSGAILFENTMDREVDNQPTADYLWKVKNVAPFLKVD